MGCTTLDYKVHHTTPPFRPKLRRNPQAAPQARVDGLEPKCSEPAAGSAGHLSATEPRAVRPGRPLLVCLVDRPVVRVVNGRARCTALQPHCCRPVRAVASHHEGEWSQLRRAPRRAGPVWWQRPACCQGWYDGIPTRVHRVRQPLRSIGRPLRRRSATARTPSGVGARVDGKGCAGNG